MRTFGYPSSRKVPRPRGNRALQRLPAAWKEGVRTASNPTPPQCGVDPVVPQLQVGLYMAKETCHMLFSRRILFAFAEVIMLGVTEHGHGME